MDESNKTNKKSKKIWPLLIVVFLVLVAGIFVFNKTVLNKTGKGNEQLRFSNSDSVYHPGEDSIEYDESEKAIYFNNLLIVYTFTDLNEDEKIELTKSVDGKIVGDISGIINALQIQVKKSSVQELNEMADVLMQNESVLYASYDFPIEMSETASNDPWSSKPGKPEKNIGKENSPGGNDWWAEAIGAYTAWDNVTELSPIKVGIIDSGFDVDHEDLEGKISFLDNYKRNSESDHGTHVAGLIAATGNNKKGIRGIADTADLVCVDWNPLSNDSKDDNYISYLSNGEYIEITKQLIENDVKVINNSWGSTIFSKEKFTKKLYNDSNNLMFPLQYFAVSKTGAYDSYIEYRNTYAKNSALRCVSILSELLYNKQDFIIVQSAGNGYDNGGKGHDARMNGFYCAIDEDLYNILSENTRNALAKKSINYRKIKNHIMVVGATKTKSNDQYKMTGFSNFGPTVDICAPGKEIFSTITNNGYEALSGTSMAAPILAGSAALVWSNNPDMTATQVKDLLIKSSTEKAVGVGDNAGKKYPMLNVGNAIISQRALKPESAVNIYLNNKSIWMKYPEYAPMNGYSYGFIDLDLDGNLELICNINDGSGRYSYNTFYKINTSDYTVSEIKLASPESVDFGGYDFTFFEEYPKLLKSKTDGTVLYYCADHLRVTTGEYQDYYGSLILDNDLLRSQIKFSEYYCDAGIEGNSDEINTYYYVENDKYTAVSKQIFDKKVEDFYSGYDDLNMKWQTIYGKDLETASLSKQKEMLLNSYKAFSYSGFSFDNIKMVDAGIELNEKDEILDSLLNNKWENNIQSYNEYVFKKDGILVKNPSDLPSYLKYKLEGDILTLIWESGYTTKLKYVNKSDNINWEKDLFFYNNVYFDLGEYEYFFYEVDYEPDELGMSNATWLRIKHESKYS